MKLKRLTQDFEEPYTKKRKKRLGILLQPKLNAGVDQNASVFNNGAFSINSAVPVKPRHRKFFGLPIKQS